MRKLSCLLLVSTFIGAPAFAVTLGDYVATPTSAQNTDPSIAEKRDQENAERKAKYDAHVKDLAEQVKTHNSALICGSSQADVNKTYAEVSANNNNRTTMAALTIIDRAGYPREICVIVNRL